MSAEDERTNQTRFNIFLKCKHVFALTLYCKMWQQDNYASSASNYYQEPLQFYAQPQGYYPPSRTSLDGQVQGSITQQPPAFGGNIQSQGAWWTAFGTGGIEGEPPLLEGLSSQILESKSFLIPRRARHQLSAYTRQIVDGPQSPPSRR